MNNDKGKLYYGVGLDNAQLRADANESKNIIRGIGDSAASEGNRIDGIYRKIGGTIAAVFTVQQAAAFAKSIVQVRGEIESLEISFQTLLGNKQKADALFSEIRTFASNTPMQLNDLAKGAQMLLSFNVEAERVMPTLKQIGDISMGDAQKFNSLTLAFSQMSSTGKLMGQDLLQMINAGFNPLSVMSEKTGKSVAQLKEEMAAGAITSEMVADAFAAATAEGGKFYGMLEKQSKGINGSISNLKGAIQDMFNELGTSNQEFITEGIQGATNIVKHYEEIGRVIGVLITSYGTYKAAVIAYAVAQKVAVSAGNIKAFFELAKGIKTAKDAQIALNLAIGANPFVKLASILMAVGGLIWAFSKNTSAATDEITGLNKAMKDAGAEFEKEAAKVEALQSVMNNSKVAYDERKRALNELKSIIPEYHAELTTEGLLINNNTSAIKDYLIQLEKQIKLKAAQDELEEAYRQKRQLEKEYDEKYNTWSAMNTNSAYYDKPIIDVLGLLGGRDIQKAEREKNEAAAKLRENASVIAELNREIETTGTTTGGRASDGISTFAEQLQAAANKVSTLKTQLASLKAGEGNEPDFAKAIKDKQEELSEAEQGYNLLLGIDKKYLKEKISEFETAERNQKIQEYSESVAKQVKQSELDIAQARIDAMDEGFNKEMAQNEQAYNRLIFANQQREAEMLEALRDARQLEWENKNPKAKAKGETFDRSTVTVADLSSEQKSSISEYYKVAEEIREKANKDSLEKTLSDVMTYEQQRNKITEDYEKKRKSMQNEDGTLKAGFSQGNVDELNRNEQEALKAVDEEFAAREETYQSWMNAIGNMTLNQLQVILAQAEKELAELEKSGTGDNKKLSVARAKVNTAKQKVAKANADNEVSPNKRTIKEWEDLYKTLREVESEFESIGDTVGGVAGEIISTAGKIMSSTLTMINGIVQLVNMSATGMQATSVAAATAISTVEKASVILAAISAALQIAMTIVNLFNNDEEYQKEIEGLQTRIDQLQWELDNADAIRLQNNTLDALQKLKQTYAETTKEVLNLHLTSNQYANTMYRFFGTAIYQNEILIKSAEKLAAAYANIAYTADKALGEAKYSGAKSQLENIAQQQLLIQQQIDKEKAKKKTDHGAIEEWERKIQELGEEANKIINEIVEDIIGGTSSEIANDLADAFFDAFQAGEDYAEAWGSKVKDIVGDVIKRMLVSKYLEEPLGAIFDKYKSQWYKDGEFAGIDAVIASMSGFASDLNAVGDEFKIIWENLPDSVKNMFTVTDDAAREASQKGIATASQESVDELNGRMTAVQGHTYSLVEYSRQLVANTAMILEVVMGIKEDTKHLERLENIEDDMQSVKNTVNDIALKGIKLK
jgi:tape measure domain-containing protein